MQCDTHPFVSVRMRREYLGIRSDDVAKRLGIKRTSYLRYERGERRVYFDQAIAVASMLGCKVDDLTRMPTPEEVSALYAEGQRRRVTPIDETTGELIPEPIDADLDNSLNKAEAQEADDGIVVDAHAHTHTTKNDQKPDDGTALAAALAGWDDSE